MRLSSSVPSCFMPQLTGIKLKLAVSETRHKISFILHKHKSKQQLFHVLNNFAQSVFRVFFLHDFTYLELRISIHLPTIGL